MTDASKAYESLRDWRPIRLKFGKVKYFAGDGFDTVYVEVVESPRVYDLHNHLRDLPHVPSRHKFVPHVTIARVKPGLGSVYALRFGSLEGTECVCNTAVFSDTDNTKYVYPLGRKITVEKAAMSYLNCGTGGALVPPAAMGKRVKLKRNRRALRRVLKDVLGADDPSPLTSPDFDPVEFVFGAAVEKAVPQASPTMPAPVAPPVAANVRGEGGAAPPQPSSPNVAKPPGMFARLFGRKRAEPVTAAPAPATAEPAEGTPEWHAKDYRANGTRARAFKAWFGDWEQEPHNSSRVLHPETGEPVETHHLPKLSSKVIDKMGRPVATFHGTPNGPFHVFDKAKIANPDQQLFGPGFYFTEEPKAAEIFARGGHSESASASASANPTVMTHYLNIRNPFDIDNDTISPLHLPPLDRQAVRSAHVQKALAEDGRAAALEAGRAFDAGQVWYKYRELTDHAGKGGLGASKTAVHDLLRDLGHDGLTVQADDVPGGEPGRNRYWIAFEPHQVKSVSNRGTFDPNDPHTLKSLMTYKKLPMALPQKAPGPSWAQPDPEPEAPPAPPPVRSDVPGRNSHPGQVAFGHWSKDPHPYATAPRASEPWRSNLTPAGETVLSAKPNGKVGVRLADRVASRLIANGYFHLVSLSHRKLPGQAVDVKPHWHYSGPYAAHVGQYESGLHPVVAGLVEQAANDIENLSDAKGVTAAVNAAVDHHFPRRKDPASPDEIDSLHMAYLQHLGLARDPGPEDVPESTTTTDWRPQETIPEDYYAKFYREFVAKYYDPAEPRDARGEWTTGGAARAEPKVLAGVRADGDHARGRNPRPVAGAVEHGDRDRFAASLAAAAGGNPALSPHQRAARAAEAKSVADKMPDGAVARLAGRLAGVNSHANAGSVTETFYKILRDDGDDVPRHEQHDVGGFYDNLTGHVQLDGGDVSGILAHELGHALDINADGTDYELSVDPEFRAAYDAELAGGALSDYAKTSAREGLAEFCRLLYAHPDGRALADQHFPLTSAFFKKRGLYLQEAGAVMGVLNELFSHAVDGPHLTHGDVLLAPGTQEKAVTPGGRLKVGGPVPVGQRGLFDESDHPREHTAHDGKRPGEFAPKHNPAGSVDKPVPSGILPAGGKSPLGTGGNEMSATEKFEHPRAALAAKHGRVIRGDGKELGFSAFVGHGTRSEIERRPLREVGEIISHSKYGTLMVTSVDKPYFVDDDHIDDMDAWSDYPDGAGWYGGYTAVPVEEVADEKATRVAKETDTKAKADAAAAAKRAGDKAWAEVSGHPVTYELPAGLPPGLKWETVFDGRTKQPMGYYGVTRHVATLPDGTKIGHEVNSGYDDHRFHYHVPRHLTDAPEAASARAVRAAELNHRATRYGAPPEQHAAAGAEFDRLAHEHYAAYRTLPAGLSPAMEARKRAALAHVAHYPEAVREIVGKHPDARAALEHHAASGEDAALAAYRDKATEVGDEAHATRRDRYTAAHEEWHPKIAAEFGAEAADEVAADVKSDHDEYSHIDDVADRFADKYNDLVEEKKESEARAAKKAARAADPLVEVIGNTYPHKDALGRIPGSKLSKVGGRWVWKVPKSQVAKLPRGLRA